MEVRLACCGILLLFLVRIAADNSYPDHDDNPCCSYPCQNQGVCITRGYGYECDCTSTGYTGRYCHLVADPDGLVKQAEQSFSSLTESFRGNEWLWNIVNRDSGQRRAYMKKLMLAIAQESQPDIYTSAFSFPTMDAYFNRTFYTRYLPPVAQDCPTPLGVVGRRQLPDIAEVGRRLFARRRFIPSPVGTNIFFLYFAQHLMHIVIRTDARRGYQFTSGTDHIDNAATYGQDEAWRQELRSGRDGKLKTRFVNGEEWPVSIEEAPVPMLRRPYIPKKDILAVGQDNANPIPFLLMIHVIWVREHNRVCSILKWEHPTWEDDQLYETARFITTGEMLKIVTEEFIPHIGNYKFRPLLDPSLLHQDRIRFYHSISYEFSILFQLHQMVPDCSEVAGRCLADREVSYNTSIPLNHGLATLVNSTVHQMAGKVGAYNFPNSSYPAALVALNKSREFRVQPFNEYRKRFNMLPYRSLKELAGGNEQLARDLEELYGDVDAVEMFVGMMVEEPRSGLVGDTIARVGLATLLQSVFANPLMSDRWWRPSTFGGETGFNIVKGASLQKLFCLNMDWCPRVSFTVPNTDQLHHK